ncbi:MULTISPECIES: 23S rRNA (guanine(745)-N(1))-methyltransferase [Pseudoalteromonas]|uniref:SAM-dependent methyltransferase n=1 Tax=Pseudoalteromonas amylolytica TaxID=1859457 RepID=A0A1S1MUG5_9GAMM|nr:MULTISPECIES: 23S rRNA (guanine(745)-N(1))-methyltransferase [Pseudoalteromonas]OHU86931.1 SAM-dependent methyltransferase [Pseudoalteromonas sp. JW3]OHU88359.1 SAM-dependent methyltransferase [Pseudoalteromonas amylolytica]
MTLLYRCPLCLEPLKQTQNSLCCAKRHQFDFAKEGYVNLLPVQNKKSKQPGDNLQMVQARRAFFATDHYVFLRQKLVEIIAKQAPKTMIDLGCGEGFYTHAIADVIDAQVYGIDISKAAVKYAAKRYKNVHFGVASIKQTPFSNHCADVLLSVFAPIFTQELQRLCNDNGTLIIVSPGPKHLFELKQYIYDDVQLHEVVETPHGFALQEHTLLEVQQQIDTDVLEHLIRMTPFAWKFKDSHYDALRSAKTHAITLSFYISEFKKVDN